MSIIVVSINVLATEDRLILQGTSSVAFTGLINLFGKATFEAGDIWFLSQAFLNGFAFLLLPNPINPIRPKPTRAILFAIGAAVMAETKELELK
jgi:hypothetical protein